MPDRVLPRKLPSQERSRETVDNLLEAARRVLVKVGYERASTNRIAQEAGVSVGSLYQYFPSKEALVAELARRHSETVLAALARKMEELARAPLKRFVREAVGLLVDAHAGDAGLHRVLVEQANVDGALMVEEKAIEVLRAALVARRAEMGPIDPAVAAPLLFHAVEAAIHRTPRYFDERGGAPRLRRELAHLVFAYLTYGADATASPRR